MTLAILILSGTVPVEKDTLNIISKPFDVSDNAPFNPGMGLTSIIMKAGGAYISLHRYMPPQRVWFFRRFGLKTGIDFAHLVFGFRGNYRSVNECIFHLSFK